ncbi:MAG: Na+/H+ antiporter subunit E [Eubacteriales bacterium]
MLIVLIALWLVLNARITPEVLIIGVAVCVPVYLFAVKFLGYSPKKEMKYAAKAVFFIGYVFVLLWEILKANFAVVGFILKPSARPSPVVVTFSPPIKTRLLQVVLANSITLTPGTITLNVENGEFTVHCLDESMSTGLGESVFVKMLSRLEK